MAVDDPRKWNYRVRASTRFTNVPSVEPVESFDIIEVYYNADDEPVAWGNAAGGLGETLEQLRSDLTRMLEACDLPVLNEDELPR